MSNLLEIEELAKNLLEKIEQMKNSAGANVSKTKTELETTIEIYERGEHICVTRSKFFSGDISEWRKTENIYQNGNFSITNIYYVLIHKKHADILDAFLEDNSVEIGYEYKPSFSHNEKPDFILCKNWIEEYDEGTEYKLKPKKEFPIFKITPVGEVWKFIDEDTSIGMISSHLTDIGIKIDKNFMGRKYDIDDSSYWTTLPYSKKREFYHLQPIWIEHTKGDCPQIEFYNVVEDTTYFDEYDIDKLYKVYPIGPEQLRTMPFIWDILENIRD